MIASITILSSALLAQLPAVGTSVEPGQTLPTDCRGCHEALETEQLTFPSGEILSVRVAPEVLGGSVHADLACTDCHAGSGPFPHAAPAWATVDELRADVAGACARCHSGTADALSDGIHAAQRGRGNFEAPTCVDCHGGHAIAPAEKSRRDLAERCGSCHEGVYATYTRSVHGSALLEGEADAPTCANCHGAHATHDPKTAAAQAAGHEVCATCHADAEKMARHELDPKVASTYLDDFHGTSNQLYRSVNRPQDRPFATCSDCHGFHDVAELPRDADGAVLGERMEKMCGECHEGATAAFSGAWMGHKNPSLGHQPVVWAIEVLYALAIPGILLALLLHIFLDLNQVRHRKEA